MELFRWVLILAGVAILLATYLLGRNKINNVDNRRRVAEESFDPTLEDLSVPITGRPSEEDAYDDVVSYQSQYSGYSDDEEFLSDEEINAALPPRKIRDGDTSFYLGIEGENDVPAREAQRTEGHASNELAGDKTDKSGGKVKSFASAVKQANQRKVRNTPLSEEFDPYSEEPELAPEEKIVTIHVLARDNKFHGSDLKATFESHGYKFGDMDIYHCHHEKRKVFSVANLVKPGSFDIDDMDSFLTPGITLFMRLPVSLDADVAFDFLIREATELAEELGGQLRDGDRSTLSKQALQHMREEIQQYVFRQKRAAQA